MSNPIDRLKQKQMDSPNHRIHLHTTKELTKRLNELCERNNISRSALVNELIKDFLDKEEKSVCIPSVEKSS